MVVHDQENEQRWAEERIIREQEKSTTHQPRSGGWSVLAVQSLACGLVVALALLLRVAGGSAYEEFRQGFQDALMRNELMSVLSRLWDGEVELGGEEDVENAVKENDFTPGETAQLQAFFCQLPLLLSDA